VNGASLIGLAGVAESAAARDGGVVRGRAQASGGGAWIDEGHRDRPAALLVGDIDRIAMLTARRAKPHLQSEDIAVASIGFANGALWRGDTSWSLNIDVGMRNTPRAVRHRGTLVLERLPSIPRSPCTRTRLPAELRGCDPADHA